MSKSTNRGHYYENKSKELLESKGWLVEKTLPKTTWIKGRPISLRHDIFGLFDLLCVKEGKVKFVQVKFKGDNTSISCLVELREKLKIFPAGTREIHIWTKEKNKAKLNIERFEG